MWYRHAKKQPNTLELIAHQVAQSAVDIWQDTHKITSTPNLPVAFSKELTQCLLDCLSDVADLTAPDEEDIYGNLKNQIESYSSLLYRELGVRYYVILSEKRGNGELDEEEFRTIIGDEVEEATLDLIRQVLKEDDLREESSTAEMKSESKSTPEHDFSFPMAEEIDLASEPTAPNSFRLIQR